MSPEVALAHVAHELSHDRWDIETMNRVAEIVVAAGFPLLPSRAMRRAELTEAEVRLILDLLDDTDTKLATSAARKVRRRFQKGSRHGRQG
jgi:hypothetical protein